MTSNTLRAGVVALAVLLAVGIASPVFAAGTTDVSLEPASDSVGVGNTTQVDVVVADADGGVGAYNLTVSVANSSTATVSDIEPSEPVSDSFTTKSFGEQNESVTLSLATMDTDDTGSVTIATVNLTGEAGGTTEVSLTVNALGDESGSSYTVGRTDGTTLSVESPSSGEGGETETPTTETPTTDTPTTDTPTDDTPTTDTPSDDTPTTDTPSDDTPTTDTPSDDTTTSSSGVSDGGGDDGDDTTSAVGPGFGALPVVFALLSLVILAKRRS